MAANILDNLPFRAELTYAGQNIRNFSFDKDARNISRRYRDFISILIMSFVAKRFEKNEPPYTAEDISEECQIPIRLTNQTLYELQEINLLHEVVTDAKKSGYCLPALHGHQQAERCSPAGQAGHSRFRGLQDRQGQGIPRAMGNTDESTGGIFQKRKQSAVERTCKGA